MKNHLVKNPFLSLLSTIVITADAFLPSMLTTGMEGKNVNYWYGGENAQLVPVKRIKSNFFLSIYSFI